MYLNSIDALRELLESSNHSGILGSCHVSNFSRIHRMTNKIEYCAVEVTCDDNTQYGIQAYGQEATALHEEALRLALSEKSPVHSIQTEDKV